MRRRGRGRKLGPHRWDRIVHPAQPGSPTVTINNTSPVSWCISSPLASCVVAPCPVVSVFSLRCARRTAWSRTRATRAKCNTCAYTRIRVIFLVYRVRRENPLVPNRPPKNQSKLYRVYATLSMRFLFDFLLKIPPFILQYFCNTSNRLRLSMRVSKSIRNNLVYWPFDNRRVKGSQNRWTIPASREILGDLSRENRWQKGRRDRRANVNWFSSRYSKCRRRSFSLDSGNVTCQRCHVHGSTTKFSEFLSFSWTSFVPYALETLLDRRSNRRELAAVASRVRKSPWNR